MTEGRLPPLVSGAFATTAAGLVVLASCSEREAPERRPASAVVLAAQTPASAEPTVSDESLRHVYTSEWSDIVTTTRAAFFGWRARITGGREDCVATRTGSPVTVRHYVRAGETVELFRMTKASPQRMEHMRSKPTWTFWCGDHPQIDTLGPIGRLRIGAPVADDSGSGYSVQVTSAHPTECTVVVEVFAIDAEGYPLEESTSRVTVPSAQTVTARVARSTASAGARADYQHRIARYAALLGRADCKP